MNRKQAITYAIVAVVGAAVGAAITVWVMLVVL